MRPLRWGLPVLAVLLVAPILTGQHGDAPDREPYLEAMTGSPPLTCSLPSLDPCTLLEEKWVDEFELPAGLTTLVLEARAKDLTALPVPTSDDNAFLLRAQGPHGYVGMVVVNAGQYAQEPWDWTMDEPAPAGLWKFEAFAAFGSYNAFHLWNFEFGLTFAYWGYELPDGYSAFPDSTDSEKSQTLLDNVDLSNAKVPCASTSWIPRTPPESSSLAAQGRSLPRSPAGLLVSPTKTC